MKSCQRCGREYPERYNFCNECGGPLADAPLAAPGAAARDGAPRLAEIVELAAGVYPTPVIGSCPACGTPTREGWSFCERCGAVLPAAGPGAPEAGESAGASAGLRAAPAPDVLPGPDTDRTLMAPSRPDDEDTAPLDTPPPGAPSAAGPEFRAPEPPPAPPPPAVHAPPAFVPLPAPRVHEPAPPPPARERIREPGPSRPGATGRIAAAAAALVALALLVVGVAGFMAWRERTADAPRADGDAPAAAPGTPATPEAPPGMAFVPGGEFVMGSDDGDPYERPAHAARVGPFFIDLTEVTVADYLRFVEATGRPAPQGWAAGRPPAGADRRPVTGVSWDDAAAYAAWAGKRLPAEAEWELASRGAARRRYPWGDRWVPGAACAGPSERGLADVGAHPGGNSPYGPADMIGNAWEWTADDLAPYPGGRLPVPPAPGEKIIRGGCWQSDPEHATTTYRGHWHARGDFSYTETGFRCAMDAAPRGGVNP